MSSKPIKDENTRMFILTIRNIREEDFGNYTCHATNSLGFDKHEIVVSGKPLPPTILPNKGSSKTEYTLRLMFLLTYYNFIIKYVLGGRWTLRFQ